MAKVRLLNGKPLMVGGKVAISDDCCCGGPPFACGTGSVIFDSIVLDCDCVNPGPALYFREPPNFNGQSILLNGDVVPCALGGTACQGGIAALTETFFVDSDCIDIDSTQEAVVDVAVGLISGVYYIIAIAELAFLVFYGTTSSLSTPASNEVVCTSGLATWSNPLIKCLYATDTHDFYGIAHSGTAALSA